MSKKKILELSVIRTVKSGNYTEGKFLIDGRYVCDTLEDKDRDLNQDGDLNDPGEEKVYGETCIPARRYMVIVDFSNRFKKRMIHIVGVPGFSGIRMHRGTTALHSLGCILLGFRNGPGTLKPGYNYDRITAIVDAWIQAGGEVWITISYEEN